MFWACYNNSMKILDGSTGTANWWHSKALIQTAYDSLHA